MSRFFSGWQLIMRRSMANWRLLSTIMAGVFVAVALLSSTPFYSNAINDLGLHRALRNTQIEMLDIDVHTPYDYVNRENHEKSGEFIDLQVSRTIRPIVRQQESWIRTQSYFAGWAGQPMPTGAMRPTGYFQVFSNLEKHVKIVDGQYAVPASPELTQEELEDPNFAIEGMIGSETAQIFHVKVGDELVFLTGFGADERTIKIRLTAIIDPIDPEEEYWYLRNDVFTVEPSGDEGGGEVAPIFIPKETMFNAVAKVVPATRTTDDWFYFIDIDAINTQNANNINLALKRMERQVTANLPRSGMMTTLTSVITQYQDKLLFTQIPLFLIVSQIVAIILYYLITVSNMLIERQLPEIALFRSRGASTWQIVGIYFMEGLVITAIGAAVGPFLGAGVFSLLGMTGSFTPLTGGGLLPIRFSGIVFTLALAAAGACLLALLVPAIQAARRGVVHHRQQAARPAGAPLWQKFYLDIVILVFGGLLYWELHQRGSLLSISFFGGLNMDPLLLITPMLLMIAVAIVFLRFFPALIGLATRLVKYLKSTPVVLGLWYIARNPVHYGRLILLLIMAASVGMFAATFLGTLQRSYTERAMFQAGADARLTQLYNWRATRDDLRKTYADVPGIEADGFAYRVDGRVGTMFTETYLSLLAVEPDTFRNIAWYRSDFSDKTLAEEMDVIAPDNARDEGFPLPDGTEKIGVWVRPSGGNPELDVWIAFRDGRGRLTEQSLGKATSDNWQYIEARLNDLTSDNLPPPPITLVDLYVRFQGQTRFWSSPGGVSFDNLQVTGAFGTEIIDDFDSIDRWTIAQDSSSGFASQVQTGTDRLSLDDKMVKAGTGAAHISWNHNRGTSEKGMFINIDTRPMSAIASQSFIDSAHVGLGDEAVIRIPGEFLNVVIKDVVDYFPTLDPDKKGFLIVNLDRLVSTRPLLGTRPINPNEAWFKLSDDPELRAQAITTLKHPQYGGRGFYDTESMISGLKSDPLAGAGWSGVLMIAFLGVILVSSLGFVVYNYLSAQSRQLDFAILRTLGFSLRQIIGLVCFEQLFIIIAGMGLGTLIGARLSNIMLPFLQLTERGEKVIPPFVLTLNWSTIGTAYGVIALAFIVTISLVIIFFSRVAIYRTLRMGDI